MTVNKKIEMFLGEAISKTYALKLLHWHVKGVGSYEMHLSLDQAINSLLDLNDRLVETTYSYIDDLDIMLPETNRVNKSNLVDFLEAFYKSIGDNRVNFTEDFTQSLLDEYQETIRQLIYRVKRLR